MKVDFLNNELSQACEIGKDESLTGSKYYYFIETVMKK